jgi:hypothetical protein
MESIIVGAQFAAQTAKQSQDNGQKHQDSMNDNPYIGGKHKNQKPVKFQIEEDKIVGAYATNWTEHTKNDRCHQGKKQGKQDHDL